MLRSSCGIGLRHTTKCWSLSGICRVLFEVTQSMIPGLFTGLPHRLSEGCMSQLGLLAFKGNGNRVVGILVGIGWCVVGRQAIWERIPILPHVGIACVA